MAVWKGPGMEVVVVASVQSSAIKTVQTRRSRSGAHLFLPNPSDWASSSKSIYPIQ